MPESRFTRPIQLTDLQMATEHARSPLKLFVAGPYIEKSSETGESKNDSPAARLRVLILRFLQDNMRHESVLGEHRGVIETGDERLRSRSSVAITELNMVRNTCDGVIIMPSSPGSFCEIGSWIIYKDVSQKMLVLADSTFEREGGYLALGAYKTAVHQGAQLRWVDYTNVDSVLEIVEEFVHKIEDGALVGTILRV